MKAQWVLAGLLVVTLLGGSLQVQGAVGAGAAQISCAVDAFLLVEGDWQVAVREIEQRGGCVRDIFPPDVLLGSLPLWAAPPAGVTVVRGPVTEGLLAGRSPLAQAAAALWNERRGALQPFETSLSGRPLTNDVLTLDVDLPEVPSEAHGLPGPYDLSEFMAGRVVVGIILPESNGGHEPQTENWDSTRMQTVINEITNAMNWWAVTNPAGALQFVYAVHQQVPTGYEPIQHGYPDDGLWMNEALTALGYPGTTWYLQAYDYLNAIRTQYGADWAVVAFVADSLNDADGMFPSGYFGYTYVNPPVVVMTYDNDGWGIGNMDSVMAHEFGHDFGAGDEYCSPGYACCACSGALGYLGIANENCSAGCDQNGNGQCDGNDSGSSNCWGCTSCKLVSCLMRTGSTASGVCTVSQQQVGMRDSDGDGKLDPVDTLPGFAITQAPGSWTGATVRFVGSVEDQPYPSPNGNSMTINRLISLSYQLDGGSWTTIVPLDGVIDEVAEEFDFEVTGLPQGPHTIVLQATNRWMNAQVVSYSFSVDSLPPTGGIAINADAPYTNNPSVMLSLSGNDPLPGSGVTEMRFSNDGSSWAAWQAYASTAAYTLSGSDGMKTVFVQYRDAAGNVSVAAVDSITLDRAAPQSAVQALPAWQLGDVDFVVQWSGSDALSGVAGYAVQVKVDDGAWTDWYSGTETSSLYDGQVGHRYAFRCRATDGAGNVEAWPTGEDAFTALMHGLFLPGILR